VAALAQTRPDWQFIVIASIALEKVLQPMDNNVNIIYWDGDIWSRSYLWLAKKTLGLTGKSDDAGFLLQSRFERFGLPWGKPSRIQKEIENLDLLWVPYYNISLKRLSLRKFLDGYPSPIILTIHDIHPYFFSDEYPDYQITRLKDEMMPFALTSSAIVTHSDFHKAAISKHFMISPERIVVTPQPPLVKPEELLKPIPKAEQQIILKDLSIHGPYVFYPASTLHQHKNHQRLLEAWRELSIRLGDNTPQLVFTSKGNRNQWAYISNRILI
jgi:glycosyltransferase involved in cell wall biosynthesis